MRARAKLLDISEGAAFVQIYGDGEAPEVAEAIERVLPAPKVGTRQQWAKSFYNTGVRKGAGTIWRSRG